MSTTRRFSILPKLVVLLLGVSTAAQAQDSVRAPLRRRSVSEDLQLFSQVLNQIRVNHADSLDTHALLMAAIEAMVSSADPHSYLTPAARFDSTRESAVRSGSFYPIPIAFQFIGGAPLVAVISPGSRAVALDIIPGDELVAVDGRPVGATSSDELDLALSGAKGSVSRLTLRRRHADGTVVRLERAVARERVNEASAVPVATMLDSITGYVRVTTFMGDRVGDDLHDALQRLERSGLRRLVLDLRGNGGGRVDEAKRIAGEFLPTGSIVYTASGRKEQVTDTGRVQRSFWRAERRYPIVVLVDDGSASASELVAGALQDHDRALIVGQTTFGKSLLMQTFQLTDGSRMALVVGRLRTPCGRVIQREYRNESRRDYYLDAGLVSDPGRQPSCRTDAGRTVYGGGGIVPDVALTRSRTPEWATQAAERGLLATWAGGFVEKQGPAIASVETLMQPSAVDARAVADFTAYALANGVVISPEASADGVARTLRASAAFAKFGEAGYYRLVALTDPWIRASIDSFATAAHLLGRGVQKP